MTPTIGIQRAIRRYQALLLTAGLLMMLLGGGIGHLVSRRILGPIADLGTGVKALAARDFRVRLPTRPTDELGYLTDSFNHLAETLEDFEVARIVQEQLFPQEPLHVGPIRVFGRCLPAAHVGGDYFDYFPLEEGRVAVLAADVSGHGFGAAMVVAMAKAVLLDMGPETPPACFLNRLHRVLLTTFHRRRMMSFCFLVLDPHTGRAELANAGHPDPLRRRRQSVESWAVRSYPLGSRKRFQAATGHFQTAPGDVLLLYSDGFVEALDHQGVPVGYDRLNTALLDLPEEDDPVLLEDHLQRRHRALTSEGPPADDITMVVVTITSNREERDHE